MSDISPISNRPSSMNAVNGSRKASAVDQPRSRAKTDSVELSSNAQLLARMAQMPEVRIDLVNQIKSQIASGEYESAERIAGAIENLAEDLT
jgi:flagellar biosynthesis anti-sigma factor FlgM